MKTNPSARRVLRIRNVTLWLGVAGMVGFTFVFSGSLAGRLGPVHGVSSEGPQPPAMSVGDFVAAASGVR